VMREKFGDKVRLPVMTEPKGWLQRRMGMRLSALSAPADWAPSVMGALDERAHWSRFGL